MTADASHWNAAYEAGGAASVSWYEAVPHVSLELLSALAVPLEAPVVDVGGGASSLAAELVARGYRDVTILDVSDSALRARRDGPPIRHVAADVRTWQPSRPYAAWHDRALLHFFTAAQDRLAYLDTLAAALGVGGVAVLGVFAPRGPERCSGLPVLRYSANDLAELLGSRFELEAERDHVHVTPAGVEQPFTWAAFRRTS